MLLVSDLNVEAIGDLLGKYSLSMELLPDGQAINDSYWGEPEAGIVGVRIIVRGDTPVHSLLHEACHIICMTAERRLRLRGNAGGDDVEECAVCYLQLVLADEVPGVGRARLMRDMDSWGYSFRLGSSMRWLNEDADDARAWLRAQGLVRADGRPTYRMRQT